MAETAPFTAMVSVLLQTTRTVVGVAVVPAYRHRTLRAASSLDDIVTLQR